MVPWFSLLRLRAIAFAAASGLMLSGCAGGAGAYDSSLSPAQNQLRQSNARFNQTVGEGAVAGALLGGAAGLAFGGRNRAQATLIGATAGGALGAGAGYAVARNNLSRSSTEAQYRDAIQQASADADAFRASAQASGQVADQAMADAKRLNGALHAGQITQAQYQSGIAKYQADNAAMTQSIGEAHKSAATMRQNARFTTGANNGQLLRSAADVDESAKQTEQNQARMSRMLDGRSL